MLCKWCISRFNHKNNIINSHFLLWDVSISHPSMSTAASTQDNDAVIRSVTSDLLCPIGIFDAFALGSISRSTFWPIDATARSERSTLRRDTRLIWQNDWLRRGLARVNQTQRTFRWSGIKRIMVSVGRRRDRSAFPNAIPPFRSRAVSLHYDPSGFRVLSCRFRASVIQFDGSIHFPPARKSPRANCPTKLCANFTAKIGEIFRQLITGFIRPLAFHPETGSPALLVRSASSQADRDSGSKLEANHVISDRLLRRLFSALAFSFQFVRFFFSLREKLPCSFIIF